jgi:hypothetical protein
MPEAAKIPIDKVRELQRKLWVCAKRSKTRRFHALYDRIYRSDVLWRAWTRVRSNGGAAGVDQATLRSIEERGVVQFLEGIQADLRAGRYRPSPVKRRWIPKADGKQRPLGIPTVRDRVVQMAAKIVVEPIFEADFLECSYGFRPKRSATQALEAIREAGNRGYNFVVDADIKGYFDNIQRGSLMELAPSTYSALASAKGIAHCHREARIVATSGVQGYFDPSGRILVVSSLFVTDGCDDRKCHGGGGERASSGKGTFVLGWRRGRPDDGARRDHRAAPGDGARP